jgi:hypothetical protein
VFSIFASSQTIVAKVYSTSGWAQEDTFIKLIVQQYYNVYKQSRQI